LDLILIDLAYVFSTVRVSVLAESMGFVYFKFTLVGLVFEVKFAFTVFKAIGELAFKI